MQRFLREVEYKIQKINGNDIHSTNGTPGKTFLRNISLCGIIMYTICRLFLNLEMLRKILPKFMFESEKEETNNLVKEYEIALEKVNRLLST